MCTLYENIKALCEKRGITGAKMCKDIGVSKSLMTSLKSGRTSTINSKTAQLIADYFAVPVDALFVASSGDGYEQIAFTDCDLQLFAEQKKEPAPTNGNGLNMYDQNLLRWFHALPAEKRQAILSLGDAPEALREDRDRE